MSVAHPYSVRAIVRSLVAPLTRTRVFRAAAPVLMPPIERFLVWVSRGRMQLSGLLVPSLTLHSTGAKTGQQRETFLMYTPDGSGRAIIAGTSFARDRHPGWTYNLAAHPEASIDVRGTHYEVIASEMGVGEAEREDAWHRIQRQWPGYRAYERESGRTVRLFRLQPVRKRP